MRIYMIFFNGKHGAADKQNQGFDKIYFPNWFSSLCLIVNDFIVLTIEKVQNNIFVIIFNPKLHIMEKQDIATQIISMEKSALERWNNGDPSGYLDIYSKDITYFDPFHEKRLDGFDVMKNLYETLRGKVAVDRYEMINPVVEVSREMATLSYNLVSYSGDIVYRWNCTEIYRLEPDNQWRIIHNHWSSINV